MQTSFQQAIDFVETGKALTITQDGQPAAMLFSFKEASEQLRLRHAAGLGGPLSCSVKESPTGHERTVYGRHEYACS